MRPVHNMRHITRSPREAPAPGLAPFMAILFVIGRRQLVHRTDENTRVLWVHMWGDPVAQIKHMPRPRAVGFENVTHLSANALGRTIQHAGVHIALQRHTVAHSGSDRKSTRLNSSHVTISYAV